MMRPVLGGPGLSDERRWAHKYIFRGGTFGKLPGGGWFNATKSRDPFAAALTGGTADVLQPGLLIGQETGSQRWATSFFGFLSAAIAQGATSATVGVTHAVEINRRVGSSGVLRIVGPAVANGLATAGLLTYSAVNTTTGVLTITATGQNEVQTVNIAGTISGGTFRLGFPQADGAVLWTGTIAHNATFATVISNANTALDALFTAGQVVASGTAYTGIALTFTTKGSALQNIPTLVMADVSALTGATGATTTETTPGFYGSFAAGSLIGQNDGTWIPKSFVPPGYGLIMADGSNQPTIEQAACIPVSGDPEWSEIAPTITDLGIRRWVQDQLGPPRGGKFIFPDFYNVT